MKKKKKLGVMDLILLLVGIFLFCFTAVMVVVFIICGNIPDTLVTCVFAICGGECGIMGWIKTEKTKHGKGKDKGEESEVSEVSEEDETVLE